MTPVSVITAAYHAEDTIARTVRSVLAQTYSHWEMIIVSDDGQDYAAILKAQGIADSRLCFSTTGRSGAGPGAARNAGLDAARYNIIANLDADDAYDGNYLATLLPFVAIYGACTPSVCVIDEEKGEAMPMMYALTSDQPMSVRAMKRHCPTFAPIMFNRRWCTARWPELDYGEDTLFWLLLLDVLPTIYFVAGARYDYYFRKGSLSRPDEKTTHRLCQRRNRMLEWLERCPPGANRANRQFLWRWISTCNDMEARFDYQLVEMDIYIRETNRRFDALFAPYEASCNLAYA